MRKIIVDSSCICYRAYYAMNGDPEGIIFNFLVQLWSFTKFFNSNNFIFCWDSRESLRKKTYPEYKANRHENKTPEELNIRNLMYKEFNKIRRDVVGMLGFKNSFMFEGFEADDIVASIAMQFGKEDNILITTDEDFYQLLGFGKIWNPNKKKFITRRTFWKEYGIPSWKWKWVKAYAGCSSDNIEGIKGIGEKTAIDFINNKLKMKSKRYKDITSKEGVAIYKKNLPLVSLPYPGLPEIEIVPNELSIAGFRQVCSKYKLRKLMANINEWKKMFRGDFNGQT